MASGFSTKRIDDGPAKDGFAITPSNTVNFTANARSVYVGVGGTVVLVTPLGTVLTFVGVVAGTILPVAAKRINATSTTATNMIGLL